MSPDEIVNLTAMFRSWLWGREYFDAEDASQWYAEKLLNGTYEKAQFFYVYVDYLRHTYEDPRKVHRKPKTVPLNKDIIIENKLDESLDYQKELKRAYRKISQLSSPIKRKILRLILKGNTQAEVAEILGMRLNSVSHHYMVAIRKLVRKSPDECNRKQS